MQIRWSYYFANCKTIVCLLRVILDTIDQQMNTENNILADLCFFFSFPFVLVETITKICTGTKGVLSSNATGTMEIKLNPQGIVY